MATINQHQDSQERKVKYVRRRIKKKSTWRGRWRKYRGTVACMIAMTFVVGMFAEIETKAGVLFPMLEETDTLAFEENVNTSENVTPEAETKKLVMTKHEMTMVGVGAPRTATQQLLELRRESFVDTEDQKVSYQEFTEKATVSENVIPEKGTQESESVPNSEDTQETQETQTACETEETQETVEDQKIKSEPEAEKENVPNTVSSNKAEGQTSTEQTSADQTGTEQETAYDSDWGQKKTDQEETTQPDVASGAAENTTANDSADNAPAENEQKNQSDAVETTVTENLPAVATTSGDTEGNDTVANDSDVSSAEQENEQQGVESVEFLNVGFQDVTVAATENTSATTATETNEDANVQDSANQEEQQDVLQEETLPSNAWTATFYLTAYCACQKCCPGFGVTTSTGTTPTAGRTIAVDPKLIPYGSKVIINGHEYIAEDCGGAIKKYRIDVFFATHSEALQFGAGYYDCIVIPKVK